jgi:hypothetical protein
LKFLNGDSWKVALLLCAIIPVGLLAAFRFASLPSSSQDTIHTLTLAPADWEFEKCVENTPLWFNSPDDEFVENSFSDMIADVTFRASPRYYSISNDYGLPIMGVRVNVTASVNEGYVENVSIIFSDPLDMSDICFFGGYRSLLPEFFEWKNLTIDGWAYSFSGEAGLEGDLKAFLKATCRNQSRTVSFGASAVHWILRAPANVSQQLEMAAEVTYFNGTASVKVVLPICARLLADAGNTFETARTVTAGTYKGYLSEFRDTVDFYRLWLSKDQTVKVETMLRHVDCVNLTLYDQDENPKAGVLSGRYYDDVAHSMEELNYTASMDGFWYLKILAGHDMGIYQMVISVDQP